MAAEQPPVNAVATLPTLPDFFTDPSAVLKDESSMWRFGQRPDYVKTRKFFAESKTSNHEVGSLPELVENLVKNWEIEASFKIQLSDWRTINQQRYTFAMNGGHKQKADVMLKNGTYNAILSANAFYDPERMDFSVSHKTFKRMMPIFAWEVLEVYSGPPKIAFRWRHWGYMAKDYVGINSDGDKITAPAHGKLIDIQGLTVADLDDAMKIVHLETWFDPMEMFNQIAPHGVVKVQSVMPGTAEFNITEEDSAHRDMGTHPEDPDPESPIGRNLDSVPNTDHQDLSNLEKFDSQPGLSGDAIIEPQSDSHNGIGDTPASVGPWNESSESAEGCTKGGTQAQEQDTVHVAGNGPGGSDKESASKAWTSQGTKSNVISLEAGDQKSSSTDSSLVPSGQAHITTDGNVPPTVEAAHNGNNNAMPAQYPQNARCTEHLDPSGWIKSRDDVSNTPHTEVIEDQAGSNTFAKQYTENESDFVKHPSHDIALGNISDHRFTHNTQVESDQAGKEEAQRDLSHQQKIDTHETKGDGEIKNVPTYDEKHVDRLQDGGGPSSGGCPFIRNHRNMEH